MTSTKEQCTDQDQGVPWAQEERSICCCSDQQCTYEPCWVWLIALAESIYCILSTILPIWFLSNILTTSLNFAPVKHGGGSEIYDKVNVYILSQLPMSVWTCAWIYSMFHLFHSFHSGGACQLVPCWSVWVKWTIVVDHGCRWPHIQSLPSW